MMYSLPRPYSPRSSKDIRSIKDSALESDITIHVSHLCAKCKGRMILSDYRIRNRVILKFLLSSKVQSVEELSIQQAARIQELEMEMANLQRVGLQRENQFRSLCYFVNFFLPSIRSNRHPIPSCPFDLIFQLRITFCMSVWFIVIQCDSIKIPVWDTYEVVFLSSGKN